MSRANLIPVTNRQRLTAALAPYSNDQVAAAVQRVCALHRNGVTVRSPYGLLISRAEAADTDFLASTAETQPARGDEGDEREPFAAEAETEVTALEADPEQWVDELAEIDEVAFNQLQVDMPDRAARLLSLPRFRHDARVRVVADRLERTR